jgi:RpiR family transcriptional regulator, carbohydrate utilization regulator
MPFKENENTVNELDYLMRIKAHYNIFSDSEKKIADYILKNHEDIIEFSSQKLADETGTSPATIVRFCRTLGFKGYTELKYYIERELLSPSPEYLSITRDDSIGVLKQKILQYNKGVIDETMNLLDDSQLDKAVNAIINARHVDIYGEGGSGGGAVVAVNIFLQIGIPCSAYTDGFLQITSASQLHSTDVAIGISHTGRAINTLDAMKEAKLHGVTTICITGYANSPITKYSDIILYTSSSSSEVLSDLPASRICEICVISVIQMAILARNYEKVIGQIRKAKEAFKVKRVPLNS